MRDVNWYAQQYTQRYGWELVPLPPMQKFPTADNWGENTIKAPEQADQFFSKHQDWGVGLVLGKSKMCSLDIDCEESFQALLAEFGLPAEDLDGYPCIKGRGRRITFRVPAGVDLNYCKLNWPSEKDPTGAIHRGMMKDALKARNEGNIESEKAIRLEAKQYSRFTVFELRVSDESKQRQDVLPPTIHPDTGEAYKWLVQPPKEGDWPEPPAWLLAIWTAFDKFKPQFVEACPWGPKPEPVTFTEPKTSTGEGGDVIQQYNLANPLTGHLTRYGYKQKGRRWLSPHSGTGIPGVHILPDGERCYIFHASDPLCSEDNGQPVNSFDLFCYYDHNNDVKEAVKAAAKELGLHKPRIAKPDPIKQESDPLAPEPETEQESDQPEHEFQCLGYNGRSIFVLPRRSEQVTKLSYGSLTKSALLQIASLEWWAAFFPKKEGVDWEMAMNALLRWCEAKGIYDERRERGRGAWYDNGYPVLHLGTKLIVDGKHKTISDHKSKYIYTKQSPIENAFNAIEATDAQAREVAAIVEGVNWLKPEHGKLALGWAVLAPICGALNWRPHLWLTAQRGAGKSWFQSYIMKPLIGEGMLLYCQGGTTEAGIRQALKHDARPVMFDEAESEDQAAAKRMQSVLELARQSSSDTGAEIVKGTANGDGMAFTVRSMFLLGSINVGLKQAADETRFSVVQLARPSRSPEEAQRFADFERHVLSTIDEDMCAAIRARCYSAIPVIRHNAKVLAQAIAEKMGSQRMGDQIGTLLAGAFIMQEVKKYNLAEARTLVEPLDLNEATEAEEVSDELNCLNVILQRQVRVDCGAVGSINKTIGELIEDVNLDPINTNEEWITLARHGIRVDGDSVLIANTHAELTRTLKDTPWNSGHRRMLLRVTGAEVGEKSMKFAGSASRYVSIPIKEVIQ